MNEEDELLKIRQKKLEKLMAERQKTKPVNKVVIEVFTSPTCPHCPRAVEMSKELAIQVPGIEVREMSTATPEGSAKAGYYGVRAVPSIFINGMMAFVGAPKSLPEFRQAVQQMGALFK
ncbi:MAG TPA: glutaredoxin [Candidatus Methanoperedenaceae archaeon]|nr:glutaredoxin [Candidatus Methanoperedenaceae archaeon]